MIVLHMQQGTDEWLEARRALPTASQADRILTKAKLQYAAGAQTYINELLTEWVTGYPFARGGGGRGSPADRGTGMEDEARAWYEMTRDVDAHQVGFLALDDRTFGGSPDSLVGEDGGLELKCPMMHTHIGYLRDEMSLVEAYHGQVQSLLFITGREWWDLASYSPVLPKVLVRVTPDAKWQEAFRPALARFTAELEEAREKLIALGVKPAPSFRRQGDPEAWDDEATYLRRQLEASLA